MTAPEDRTTRALLRRQLTDQLARVRLLQDHGKLAEALTAVEHLLHTATDHGFDSATVWTARRIHAELLYDLGDTTQAHQLATTLYARLAATLPPRHPALIRTAVLLAGISHHEGDLDVAEHLCRWVLQPQPSQQAPDQTMRRRPASRALLLARAHLALITADHGDPTHAIDQLTQTLHQLQDRYGGRDFDTIRIRAQLADLHTAFGHRVQAQRLLTRALHDACARYGPTHPVSARLDQLLSAVEPPLPSDDPNQQTPAARGQTHKPKHAITGDTAPASAATARSGQPKPPSNDDAQPLAHIQDEHRPLAPAQVSGIRRPTRRHLARAAWSLGIIAGLATAGVGLQALRQPAPPANAQSSNFPASSPSVDANPVAANLTIRRGAQPRQIVVTWTDTSDGTATPILSITDSTGQAIATLTLPSGTERYQRDHLNPHISYCVMLALFTSAEDTSATGQQACLPDP